MFPVCSDDAVVEVMGQMHGLVAAAHRQFLAAVLEADQRELWRADGAHSIEMWLQMRFGLSHATARSSVRVARGFVFTPELAARYAAGFLSWDQVRSAVDLVAHTGASDAAVAEDAVGRTAAELDRLAREARRVTREESEARQRLRYLRLRWQPNGMLRLSGLLPDVEGRAFEVLIRRLAEDQPNNPEQVPVLRPVEERQADALSDLVSTRIAQDAEPDRATVVVHCEASALVDDGNVDPLASIELGPLVPRSTVLRLCCDGRIQLVVDDEHGAAIKIIRTEHAIPPWMRRKVLHRDGGCRWPGCGRTAFLHVHHVEWWSRGGLTKEANLCTLCTFHHRLVHEGGWTLTGDPFAQLTITSPTGRRLTAGPPPLRDDIRRDLGLPPPRELALV